MCCSQITSHSLIKDRVKTTENTGLYEKPRISESLLIYSSDFVESPAGGADSPVPSAADFLILASYLSIPSLISLPVLDIVPASSSLFTFSFRMI